MGPIYHFPREGTLIVATKRALMNSNSFKFLKPDYSEAEMKAMKNFMIAGTIYLGAALLQPSLAPADQTTGEKAKETVHNVQDKTCEMINGKLQCAGKKIKHKVGDKVDSLKK
jgi:uncharacterized protein YjbJ (UPF0337 family)